MLNKKTKYSNLRKVMLTCFIFSFILCSCNNDNKPSNNNISDNGVDSSLENNSIEGNKTKKDDEAKGNNETTKNNQSTELDDKTNNKLNTSDSFIDEALSEVLKEYKEISGLDNAEATELFSYDGIYFIKIKSKNYEIWRYEKNTPRRVLSDMKEVKYNQENGIITIYGPDNNYLLKTDEENKKIIYECYYTHILNSENGDYTCYINDFYSVCVVDNNSDEVILNKYIDIESKFSNEDFVLDNSRKYERSRLSLAEAGWIKNSNIAYMSNYDCVNFYVGIDIDKKIVFNMCGDQVSTCEGYLDIDEGYVISSTIHSSAKMDIISYMVDKIKRENKKLYLTNIYTLESFEIAQSISMSLYPKYVDNNIITYLSDSGQIAEVDISDYIGKERINIINNIKNLLCSEYELDKIQMQELLKLDDSYFQVIKLNSGVDSQSYQLINYKNDDYKVLAKANENITLTKFNNKIYAYIEDSENSRFVRFSKDNEESVIMGKFEDINFSEHFNHISLYKNNGDITILDNNGDEYLSLNLNVAGDEELAVTVWDKNDKNLYVITKNEDTLGSVYRIDINNKSCTDIAGGIDCKYYNIYIDFYNEFMAYTNYPRNMYYGYDGENEFKDDVYLYLKYFNSDEIIELAHSYGERIELYYVGRNVLDYYFTKSYANGSYTINTENSNDDAIEGSDINSVVEKLSLVGYDYELGDFKYHFNLEDELKDEFVELLQIDKWEELNVPDGVGLEGYVLQAKSEDDDYSLSIAYGLEYTSIWIKSADGKARIFKAPIEVYTNGSTFKENLK